MRPVRKIFDALENHQPGTSALSRESGLGNAVTLGTNILTPAGGALIPAWKSSKRYSSKPSKFLNTGASFKAVIICALSINTICNFSHYIYSVVFLR